VGRLKHPETETVVSVEGDLEAQYKASGWVDADASADQALADTLAAAVAAPDKRDAAAEPEQPAPRRRTSK
jgi:hypothetical protein